MPEWVSVNIFPDPSGINLRQAIQLVIIKSIFKAEACRAFYNL